jgi:ABC-type Fe3+-hydroxamate transport system substrate-binding protein
MAVRDALGRALELPGPPKRIVSLVPSLTEALFAFGAGERVVGLTHFCLEPRAEVRSRPKVGGTKTVEVARVLALAPDLVIASAEENRPEHVEAIAEAGVPVYVTLPTTVVGALHLLEELARLLGVEEGARPLLEGARRALAETQALARGRARPRLFCPIWRQPWMTIGPGTYMHDLIATCGGDNIFADVHERYPVVELTEAARRRPEVVLLPSEPFRFRRRHLAELEAAGLGGARVHFLDGRLLCWYGPRIPEALVQVRQLLLGV